MSWKVRRAAAKCLDAVIGTRHEMLMDFYKNVSPALIARFKGEGHFHCVFKSNSALTIDYKRPDALIQRYTCVYNSLCGVFRERRECEGRHLPRFCDPVETDSTHNHI